MAITRTLYEKDLYPELEEASATSYGADCMHLLAEKLETGEINRRTFLRCAALLSALPLGGLAEDALAQAKELVLVNWGGESIPAYKKSFTDSFEKATGIKVVFDGSGPQPAKLRAMRQSGKIVWDLLDFNAEKAALLDAEGLVQDIDYSIVDKSKIFPGWAYKAGAAFYVYSTVFSWDSSKYATNPNTWADFWDLKKFPGRRGMRKTPEGGLEACMMAAGRSIKNVYPIDLKLAMAKIKEIKSETIFWTSGSQSQDILRNGEVTMVLLWHSRAISLFKQSNGRFNWTFNQGLMNIDVLSVVRDNPGGRDAAMRLIAHHQDPERQVELLRVIGNAPVNPAASLMVPDDLKRFDPTQPQHRSIQAELNPDWWAAESERKGVTNDTLAREMWLDATS
jgi:putative spermidine/putrescine transport system substrate-binding protein